MALSHITEKIDDDAKRAIEKIRNNTKSVVSEIEKQGKEEEQILREEHEKEEKRISEENKRRVLALSRHQKQMLGQKARRAVLDEIFSETLAKLETLDNDRLESLLVSLLSDTPDDSSLTISFPKGSEGVIKKALKKVKRSFETKESSRVSSGFTLTGKDVEYDFTFSHLVSARKNELEVLLAQNVFVE